MWSEQWPILAKLGRFMVENWIAVIKNSSIKYFYPCEHVCVDTTDTIDTKPMITLFTVNNYLVQLYLYDQVVHFS